MREPVKVILWILGPLVVLILAMVALGSFMKNHPPADDDATAAAKANAHRLVADLNRKTADATQECRTSRDSREAEYSRLLAAGKFADAGKALGDCPRLLSDQAMIAQALDADTRDRRAQIEDAHASTNDRLAALAAFAKLYPDEAKTRYGELGAKLRAKSDADFAAATKKAQQQLAADQAREQKADAARRRKEGVSIGMSQDDVLHSSWGRPEHVNRTIRASGTEEQWVYGTGSYLYFRDGVLYAIQN